MQFTQPQPPTALGWRAVLRGEGMPIPEGEPMVIYDAASVPLLIVAGKEYGQSSGSPHRHGWIVSVIDTLSTKAV